jgi:hypothetical protein
MNARLGSFRQPAAGMPFLFRLALLLMLRFHLVLVILRGFTVSNYAMAFCVPQPVAL